MNDDALLKHINVICAQVKAECGRPRTCKEMLARRAPGQGAGLHADGVAWHLHTA
jgi:hypothetical protein